MPSSRGGAFDLLRAMRPPHWIKNLLVFAPAFFSGRITDAETLADSAAVFAVFCAAASAMYLLNDVADARADSAHPLKKNRPLAAGRISAGHHIAAATILAAAALIAAAFIPPAAPFIAAYLILGAAYSFLLKKIPAVGELTIAAGLILRIVTAAAVVGTPVSPWVYPCVLTLSLYVVAGKRIFDSEAPTRRMETAFLLLGAAAFFSYAAYSVFMAQSRAPLPSLLSILPALAGLARYRAAVHRRPAAREHLAAAAADPLAALALAAWTLLLAWSVYAPR